MYSLLSNNTNKTKTIKAVSNLILNINSKYPCIVPSSANYISKTNYLYFIYLYNINYSNYSNFYLIFKLYLINTIICESIMYLSTTFSLIKTINYWFYLFYYWKIFLQNFSNLNVIIKNYWLKMIMVFRANGRGKCYAQ